MAKGHLSNDEFFAKLAALFASNTSKDHGSVFLTQKRLTHGTPLAASVYTGKASQVDDLADLDTPAAPLPVLVRATNGDSRDKRSSKVKLATVVAPDNLEAFFARYADACRAGMAALKKRDRSAQKKKARKRKVAAEGVGAGSAK